MRKIVLNSAKQYASLIERPCTSTKDVHNDFVWGDDLYESPFRGSSLPIFSVILNMDDNGPFYTSGADEFEVRTVIINYRLIGEL